MKNIFFILFSLFIINATAQCIVDAGSDIHMCLDQNGLDTLNPILTNATYPINIKWEYKYQIPNSTWVETSSSLLNDTTSLNAYFIQRPFSHSNNTFYLSIIDSFGFLCADSLTISYSLFDFVPDNYIELIKGDTGLIYAILSSNYPPYVYNWSPNYNISDTSASQPLIWPSISTSYQAIVTDSMNCKIVLPQWQVALITNIVDLTYNKLNIFPNPTKNVINITYDFKTTNLNITILNMQGQIVFIESLTNNQINLDRLNTGLYSFIIREKKRVLSYGKIRKQ